MACRLSQTDAGELSYLRQGNHDALVVDVGDAPAMAVAIHHLLTEPELVEKFSHNARTKAEHYDWLIIMPQWEQLFGKIIAHG